MRSMVPSDGTSMGISSTGVTWGRTPELVWSGSSAQVILASETTYANFLPSLRESSPRLRFIGGDWSILPSQNPERKPSWWWKWFSLDSNQEPILNDMNPLLASSVETCTSTSHAVTGLASHCPDYSSYSLTPHGNASTGTLGLPYMRPSVECRTFTSCAVEKVITDMTSRLKDPDIARLFENTFANTLDTTVKYYDPHQNLAFIITGDINAQWLRDTANQFAQYKSLFRADPQLAKLVKAVINNEARYISKYPYCGAFQPPPESGLPATANDWATGVFVSPPVDNETVFECKFELDSLCGFLKLSASYFQETKDASILNDNWFAAVKQIFQVIDQQSKATFDKDFNLVSYYSWTGGNGALSPPVNNNGIGEPKGYSGLVATHHRPSDDLSTFPYLTPANAMLAVELTNLADMLDSAKLDEKLSLQARNISGRITKAIWDTTVVDDIFAYETNGLGSRYVMDDANVPSLLSLPYLGFLDKKHPAYVATKKVLLSRSNPYYAKGKDFFGIGGPHIAAWNPWPMSLISSVYGSDDDQEIMTALYTIANSTNGLGLIHESISIQDSSFTRPWFAWANSYFSEMLLDLASRKPHLIFKTNETYHPGKR